jgi:hypothetical protein
MGSFDSGYALVAGSFDDKSEHSVYINAEN